jgi:hypothetical protein
LYESLYPEPPPMLGEVLEKAAPAEKVFDVDHMEGQAEDVLKSGLTRTEPYWNFGQFTRLGEVIPELRSGIWYLIAPENVGKSQLAINISYEVMRANPDSYWVDFSLDDPMEMRLSYLLARTGELPISLIVRAGDAIEEDVLYRNAKIVEYAQKWTGHHRIYATYRTKEGRSVDPPRTVRGIIEKIATAREELGPKKKLWVTVDGFHDVRLDGVRVNSENEAQQIKSQQLKDAAHDYDCMILMTAHCRKDSRRRGVIADSFKGDNTVLYDGMVVTTLYSDVNMHRDAAELYWQEKESGERKLPVLELDVVKNKAGAYKDVLFYNFLPGRCWAYEVDQDTQRLYRAMVFGEK